MLNIVTEINGSIASTITQLFVFAFYRCRSKWGHRSWTCCPTRRWSRSTRSTPHSWGRRWTRTRRTRPWEVDPQIWGTCRTRSPAFTQTLPLDLIVTHTPKSLHQLQVIWDVKNILCFGFTCFHISYPLFQFLCLLCSPPLWIKGHIVLNLSVGQNIFWFVALVLLKQYLLWYLFNLLNIRKIWYTGITNLGHWVNVKGSHHLELGDYWICSISGKPLLNRLDVRYSGTS